MNSAALHRRYFSSGFTLLEMLVALAIFGLIAVMAYGGLSAVLNQQAQTEAAADRLSEIQKTYLIMQRDIEQMVLRPVRDEFGDEQAPLIGGDSLRFTRGGWSNPVGYPRSSLQRVGYDYEEQQLKRYSWAVLDRAQDSEPLEQPLLDQVEGMQIRYLAANDEWQEQWPAAIAAGNTEEQPAELPKAVEVTIEHAEFGPLVWFFQLL
jgi:general secretion pathway protein J